MRADDMYAAIILLSGVGYLLNRLFLAVEARSIHWARVLESRGSE
jgi:ABC-type nitrate/sulfonate/bicarbonate transport system permease component